MDDSIRPLVRHSVNTRLDDIPADVVDRSVELFVDIVGCILAGSSAEGIDELVETGLSWYGGGPSKIMAFDRTAPAPEAAFLNAVMGHAHDFDDTHDGALNHGCVTIVPALLALSLSLAEAAPAKDQARAGSRVSGNQASAGGRVSGRDLIAALAVGLDISNRLGMAFIPYLHVGWLPTTLWGPIATAGACGRLLHLDERRAAHAFGFAYAQIHGNRQALVDGALAKRIQPGFSAAAGLKAALYAASGLTAAGRIIDGEFGIPALYTKGRLDRSFLADGIGEDYQTSQISIKPYPSCRCSHPVIDAALELKERHALDPADIRGGEILLPPQSMGQIGQPFRIRDNPTVDAQFSAQFTAALALLRGRPRIRDFGRDAVRDAADVIELAGRFNAVVFEKQSPTLTPVEVRITTRSGRTVQTRVEHPKGSPANPLERRELMAKLDDCLDTSRKSFAAEHRKRLAETLFGVLDLDDVTTIFDMV